MQRRQRRQQRRQAERRGMPLHHLPFHAVPLPRHVPRSDLLRTPAAARSRPPATFACTCKWHQYSYGNNNDCNDNNNTDNPSVRPRSGRSHHLLPRSRRQTLPPRSQLPPHRSRRLPPPRRGLQGRTGGRGRLLRSRRSRQGDPMSERQCCRLSVGRDESNSRGGDGDPSCLCVWVKRESIVAMTSIMG